MGGWGSGRQGGPVTIEGCGSCRLTTKNLRELLRAPAGGSRHLLYRADGEHLTVAIEVQPEHGYLRLQHPPRAESRTEHMDYTVGLVSTEVGFGGRRWWFLLPGLRASLCGALPAARRLPVRQRQGLSAGLWRDPAGRRMTGSGTG